MRPSAATVHMSRIQLRDGKSAVVPASQGTDLNLDYWHGIMWNAVWSAEMQDLDMTPLQYEIVQQFYRGVPAQLAGDCDKGSRPSEAAIDGEHQ